MFKMEFKWKNHHQQHKYILNGHLPENKSYPEFNSGYGEVMIPFYQIPLTPKKLVKGRSVEKNLFLSPKCIFLANLFFETSSKRQGFCVEPVAQGVSGRTPRPIFGPKFFFYTPFRNFRYILRPKMTEKAQ